MRTFGYRRATEHLAEAARVGWRRWPSRILLLGMGFYAVAQGLGAVSPAVASVWMRRFHTDLPFPVWAALQPAPAMYSFENEAIWKEQRRRERHETVNHHLYRVLADQSAWWEPRMKKGGTMTLRSTYQGQTIETQLRVRKTSEGLFVER